MAISKAMPMAMMREVARPQDKNTCQRIDLSIRRKVPIIKEGITKIITTKRVKARKVDTKKEVGNLTTKSMEWGSLKIRGLLMFLISSHISKICNRWTNLKFKNYSSMYSPCMATILQA